MKKVCLPYKERFLDTILYGAKKILRAIHKGITSFFFYLIPVLQTAPSLKVTIKQNALLRQRVVVVIIGLNYCALGRFPIVRTDRPHQSPTSYFENEIGFFQEFFRLKNVLFRVYYLGFDWSGWRVLIKRETIIATGMVWPVSSDKWKVPFKQFPLMTSTASHSKHTDFTLHG